MKLKFNRVEHTVDSLLWRKLELYNCSVSRRRGDSIHRWLLEKTVLSVDQKYFVRGYQGRGNTFLHFISNKVSSQFIGSRTQFMYDGGMISEKCLKFYFDAVEESGVT